MGNVRSEHFEKPIEDPWWNNTDMEKPNQSLAEFKKDLEIKHEKRRQLIAEKRKEMQDMKQELENLKKENAELKNVTGNELKETNEELKLEIEKLKLQLKNGEEIATKNNELRISIAQIQTQLQNANTELVTIEQERLEYTNHVTALKDVVRVTKNMLEIRENQIEDLKTKIKTVEELLASKEMKIMSDSLREEYEKQLRNIRHLRTLYEERSRIDKKDKEKLKEQLDETQKSFDEEQRKTGELQERVSELEEDTSKKYDAISNLQSTLGLSKAECKELQAEINIINQLFSETLLGFNNSQEIDLDKLIKTLEENHDLLTKFANEEINSTAAALPKLLLDLISQIDKDKEPEKESEIPNAGIHHFNSVAEIVQNLPKVWKVLIELLSHQNPPSNALFGEVDPCYKSVETPTGPKLKLSVSQTFIRLKDLILEKKFLERETFRLKHLNTHLEGRLQDQEKRLGLVSGELQKTWHVVGKMQRQHQQLHTHEKVLRHELREKRKLLTELKEELAYCREKWVLARAKNDTTQEQWKQLRQEFSDRKTIVNDDFNQSAESGYSDDKDSSEDERSYETKKIVQEINDKTDSVQKDEANLVQIVKETTVECTISDNLDTLEDVQSKENSTQFDIVHLHNLMKYVSEHAQTSSAGTSKLENSHEEVAILKKDNADALTQDTIHLKDLHKCDLNLNSSPECNNVNTSSGVEKTPANTKEIETISNKVDLCNETELDAIHSQNLLNSETTENSSLASNTEVVDNPDLASTSKQTGAIPKQVQKTNRTPEEILAAREERLKRLESECKQLVTKVTNTSQKSVNLSQKLDNLHEIYSESKTDSSNETNDNDENQDEE